jgi:hypothetical protein
MVLKKFSLNQVLDDGNLVTITGRKSGLLSWLLTLTGIDPEVGFVVTAKDFRFYNKSLFGEKNIVMTLRNVSHINCEYSRPFWYLVFAVLSLLAFVVDIMNADDIAGVFYLIIVIFCIPGFIIFCVLGTILSKRLKI